MEDPEIDPPDTLRGLLQRGRGAGAQQVAAAPERGREPVFDCVRADPRWDRQVESRDVYFARLIRDHRWPLDPIAEHLFCGEDDTDGDGHRTGLAIGVLGALARAGRGAATDLLRRYVARGWNWSWALHELADLPWPQALTGLDTAVLGRLSEAELVREVGPGEPWAADQPRVRAALEAAEVSTRRGPVPASIDVASLPGAQLAECVLALGADSRYAARELARRGDVLLLDLAEEWLPRRPGGPGAVLSGALRQFASDALLGRAREWARAGRPCRSSGVDLLAERGDASDAQVILNELDAALSEGWWRDLPGLVEGLGRIRCSDAEALILRAWDAQYSYTRPRVLWALVEIGSRAAPRIAEEALWDCEESAREQAVRVVGGFDRSIRERLDALADDPLEADDIRAAASARGRPGGV
jgi:hypothetical protein